MHKHTHSPQFNIFSKRQKQISFLYCNVNKLVGTMPFIHISDVNSSRSNEGLSVSFFRTSLGKYGSLSRAKATYCCWGKCMDRSNQRDVNNLFAISDCLRGVRCTWRITAVSWEGRGTLCIANKVQLPYADWREDCRGPLSKIRWNVSRYSESSNIRKSYMSAILIYLVNKINQLPPLLL